MPSEEVEIILDALTPAAKNDSTYDTMSDREQAALSLVLSKEQVEKIKFAKQQKASERKPGSMKDQFGDAIGTGELLQDLLYQQKPAIGDSVFYHDTWKNGKIYPAIVVAVESDTVLDLAYIDIDQNPCVIPARGIHFSEDPTSAVGKWSWPPKV